MAATIARVIESVRVAGVGRLALTTVEQDPATGEYVRQLRVFGKLTDSDTSEVQVFTCEVRGTTRDSVEITTPQLYI